MIKFGFVILHYKCIDKTVQCINSITKLEGFLESTIVIVDNGSNDGSYEKLVGLYGNVNRMKIICNSKNLGFSKGNNIGYRYLKDSFPNLCFIIIINNDIIIYQEDFLEKLEQKFQEYRFAVAGPDIYTPREKKHYNPLPYIITKPEQIEKRIKVQRKILKHSFYNYLIEVFKKFVGKSIRTILGNYSINKDALRETLNKPLHGSALFFSSEYVKKNQKAFEPETFLFREEDILYAKCIAYNMKILYTPEIQVVHEHSSSRRLINNNVISRYSFTQTEYIKSDIIYLEYIKKLKTHGFL